ncbi:MAG: hypothetical protein R3362_08680, partial [Rhodothermales bacterium]|nr:hypothetical protein [Rhodothermales bacterium]
MQPPFIADYAVFQYDPEVALLETYLAFDVTGLPYVEDSVGYVAELPVAVSLRPTAVAAVEGAATAPVWADTVAYRFAVADTAGLDPSQYFLQQLRAAVPPGEYELVVTAVGDAASERPEVSLPIDVTVPDFAAAGAAGRAMVSDVTLATEIRRAEEGEGESPFYRNGLVIQPNPNALFGGGRPLFYYAEAYGLDQAFDGDTYTLLAYVAP